MGPDLPVFHKDNICILRHMNVVAHRHITADCPTDSSIDNC